MEVSESGEWMTVTQSFLFFSFFSPTSLFLSFLNLFFGNDSVLMVYELELGEGLERDPKWGRRGKYSGSETPRG